MIVPENSESIREVTVSAIGSPKPVLRLTCVAFTFETGAQVRQHTLAVMGMNQFHPLIVCEAWGRVAKHCAQSFVPPDLVVDDVPIPQHIVGGFSDETEPLFAFGEPSHEALFERRLIDASCLFLIISR